MIGDELGRPLFGLPADLGSGYPSAAGMETAGQRPLGDGRILKTPDTKD